MWEIVLLAEVDEWFLAAREAVILVAGDKASQWNHWYRVNLPITEGRYERYLVERKAEEGS